MPRYDKDGHVHHDMSSEEYPHESMPYSEAKKGPAVIETHDVDEKDDELVSETDHFIPYDDLPDERPWILTTRAVIIGIIAGSLVNASNLYIGLKTGWTFAASLFGAIMGFGIITVLSKSFAENFPILGGSFGPRENNIVQTTATAAGGMSSVFISAFPALYQLKLLKTPQEDMGRIISITAVAGFFGLFFATPCKFRQRGSSNHAN
jgi:OPT oligopeptide transporter protein